MWSVERDAWICSVCHEWIAERGDLMTPAAANDALEKITRLEAEKAAADQRTLGLINLLHRVLLKLGVLPNANRRPPADLIAGADDWLRNAADRYGSCKPPCAVRRKIPVFLGPYRTKEDCGVDDSELAEFMRYDLRGSAGHPVIQFRYCPWCGKRIPDDALAQVLDVEHNSPPEAAP